MTLALYALSKRQDIQDKLRSEIFEVLRKYNGELTYEALNDMKYMQQVLEGMYFKFEKHDIEKNAFKVLRCVCVLGIMAK